VQYKVEYILYTFEEQRGGEEYIEYYKDSRHEVVIQQIKTTVPGRVRSMA
jgi:hypothetical protein